MYYFKFGGPDPNLNWGSRAVYFTGSLSRVACHAMFDRIFQDWKNGRPWIVQEARTYPEVVAARTRSSEEIEVNGYTKLSAFYGPRGLVGVLAMQERSRKVHGSPETVLSIVF